MRCTARRADTIVDGRYRVVNAARLGRDGRRLLRRGPPARAPGRAEGALPPLRRGRGVRRALPPRGVAAPPACSTSTSSRVYDRGEWDGTYYIAMEFLDGPHAQADRRRAEAPLDPERAVDLTIQVLRAARFAHRRGVIHRDLKPHNVIVDEEGRAKVTDFGIARAGASDMTADGLDHGHGAVPLARAGPGPPGQRRGPTSTRSGSCSTSCSTGQLPFDGESAVTIALKQVNEPPPPPSASTPRSRPRSRPSCCARWRRTRRGASPTPTSSSPRCEARARPRRRPTVPRRAATAPSRDLRPAPRRSPTRTRRARDRWWLWALLLRSRGCWSRLVVGATCCSRRARRSRSRRRRRRLGDAAAELRQNAASRSTSAARTSDQAERPASSARTRAGATGREGLDGDAHRLRRAGAGRRCPHVAGLRAPRRARR